MKGSLPGGAILLVPALAAGWSPVFEENLGQADPRAAFLGRTPHAMVWFTAQGPVLGLRGPDGTPLELRFPGGSPDPRIEGSRPLAGRINHLRGPDPACWVAGARTFERVRYSGLRPGVDAEFYWTDEGLEYDLLLASAGAARDLEIEFAGSREVRLRGDGTAEIELPGGRVLEQRPPRAYRPAPEGNQPIGCRFVAAGLRSLRLEIDQEAGCAPLVVDPELVLLVPLGGGDTEDAYAVATDPAGNLYLAGYTRSTDFPLQGALQGALLGIGDGFVAKLDPTGTTLLYATYLGGSGDEDVRTVAVDAAGSAVVGGVTDSLDFPLVSPFQGASGGRDEAFLARLLPDGSGFGYSTYLGGSGDDFIGDVAIHASGDTLAVGYTSSVDFPTFAPYQPSIGGGTYDAFVLRLAPDGSPVFSTYFGGSGWDTADGVADAGGDILVAGQTDSDDIPIVSPYQPARLGTDALLLRIEAGGQAILQSTYFGGSLSDYGTSVAVDAAGDIYLAGNSSSPDFPARLAIQAGNQGDLDAFVSRFDPALTTLRFSTLLGGGDDESVRALAIVEPGIAHVAGLTRSRDYPLLRAIQPFYGGGQWDGFLSAIDTGAGAHLHSTYIGADGSHVVRGLAAHPSGDVVVATSGAPEKMPPVPPARPWSSNEDAVLLQVKIAMDGGVLPAASTVPPAGPVSHSIRVENAVGRTVSAVQVFEVIDACLDVSSFDPATLPAQVQTSAPATVVWTPATRTLQVDFSGDFAVGASETIDVSGLLAGAPANTCPHTASIIHQSDPNGIVRTTSIQIEGCAPLPEIVTGLRAVKSGASVALSWDPPRDAATQGFHVWRVGSGEGPLVPRASRLGAADLPFRIQAACNGATIPASSPACVDALAVVRSPDLFHYQVRGLCTDGSEGIAHPF